VKYQPVLVKRDAEVETILGPGRKTGNRFRTVFLSSGTSSRAPKRYESILYMFHPRSCFVRDSLAAFRSAMLAQEFLSVRLDSAFIDSCGFLKKQCSIDALLEKTIKYINFLQTVTVKWKEIIKLQVVRYRCSQLNSFFSKKSRYRQVFFFLGHGANKEILTCKQGGAKGMGGGASWAVELGEDGNTCPIIVENLSQPGHLLVEVIKTVIIMLKLKCRTNPLMTKVN
jgi:hypothetical protein